MELCFVTKGSLDKVWQENLSDLIYNGVNVFGFNGLGIVSYKRELDGETEYFQDLTRLSRELSSVIISGCDTDTYGVYRHSAVIADSGKLIGVTDMAHSIDKSEYVSGGNFRVYDTTKGKIGLLINEDIYFPESARVLSLCDADIIICIYKKLNNMMPQLMIRTGAFSNGVAMALLSENYCAISDIKGEIKISGTSDIIKAKVNIEKDYHLIASRRKGLYRDFNSGY